MSLVVICLVALGASMLTLYSGFGLGTLLLPAFAMLFPVELAVGATALVHLLNNLFKLLLVGAKADLRVALVFGLAAVPGAWVGASALGWLTHFAPLASYELLGATHHVTGIKLVIGALIALFAAIELSRVDEGWRVPRRLLPLGGLLSGFFGGLSGHQGALRSAFLIQSGLTKEAFVATGVIVATAVDLTRLAVYGRSMLVPAWTEGGAGLRISVLAACLSAFAGAWIGVRLLGKVTLSGVRRVVGTALLVLAVAMAAGLV